MSDQQTTATKCAALNSDDPTVICTDHGRHTAAAEYECWADDLPPKGCVMDEFGRLWRVTYMQEWSSGKRQFTVEPAAPSGRSGDAT